MLTIAGAISIISSAKSIGNHRTNNLIKTAAITHKLEGNPDLLTTKALPFIQIDQRKGYGLHRWLDP
jgi:hypothetical protein